MGEQICDPWNYEANDFYPGQWHSNSLYKITCKVLEQIPGAWNATAIIKHYRGTTWNHSSVMMLGYDGKLSMYELFPGKDLYINNKI